MRSNKKLYSYKATYQNQILAYFMLSDTFASFEYNARTGLITVSG